MHGKEPSLLLCFHVLWYPLLFLSQGSICVPWVSHKPVKVWWRWPVVSLKLSGRCFIFKVPGSIHFAYILRLVCAHGFTNRVLTFLSCFGSIAAGCWKLQLPHYVRCVYQMPVSLVLCLSLCSLTLSLAVSKLLSLALYLPLSLSLFIVLDFILDLHQNNLPWCAVHRWSLGCQGPTSLIHH